MPQRSNAYCSHSLWSAPGPQRTFLESLPADPRDLPDTVAGLLLHFGVAPSRGIEVPAAAARDRMLRRTDEMLGVLQSRNAGPANLRLPPEDRFFCVCRHFALLAAARLRQAG